MTLLVPLIRTTRPAFLTLAPVCVFLGASTAVAGNSSVDLSSLILAMLGGIFAHISVNTLNEVHDFRSGLDFNTERTAFSGGSGTLPKYPEFVGKVFVIGILSFVATIALGVYFFFQHGWGILPIGVVGMLVIASYSGWITKHPFICLVAPGVGFGFLLVVGTAYVLTGRYSPMPAVVGLVPFCLCNNLLLLNQFPDIAADRAAGRRTFPIVFGTTASAYAYAWFLLVAIATILIGVSTSMLPKMSLIALTPLPFALIALWGALNKGLALGRYPRYLVSNVATAVITPLLLAISLIIG